MSELLKWFRILTVYIGYLAYYCLFWYSLSRVLKQTGVYTDAVFYSPAVILTIVFLFLQIIQVTSLVTKNDWRKLRWLYLILKHKEGIIHLPMFIFIILSIAPYGVILKHAYMASAIKANLIPHPLAKSTPSSPNTTLSALINTTSTLNQTHVSSSGDFIEFSDSLNGTLQTSTIASNTTQIPSTLNTGFIEGKGEITTDHHKESTKSCHDLSIENFDFFVLQSVFPLLVVSQTLFPYPTEQYSLSQACVVALKLVESFDMMDLLSDVWCVVESGDGLQFVYFFALGFAGILLPISVSLEDLAEETAFSPEGSDDYEESKYILWLRKFKSIMTLICMDILFFVIRILLMIQSKNIQNGYGFLIKEFFSTIFRSYYICVALTKVHPK